jgi:hypothetical protein
MADNDNIYLSANGVKHLTNKPMESKCPKMDIWKKVKETRCW